MEIEKKLFMVNIALAVILIVSLGVNEVALAKIYSRSGKISTWQSIVKGQVVASSKQSVGIKTANSTGDVSQDSVKFVISAGVPKIYGDELAVSFSQVQASMDILKEYDPTYGQRKIALSGDYLKRYVDIGLRIACEYCCGAKSIVFSNGQAACGCAHSQAMRGLAAYLIQNHGSEYSNDEILRELARWKGMFFPKQMIQKMASQLQGNQFTTDIAAILLGVKLPDYGQGGGNAPVPSEINSLPSMVGGC